MSPQLRRAEPRRSPPSKSAWHDTAEFSRRAGRGVNMDALGHAEAPSGIGVWVVADGLGGHPRSEVASSLAVKAVLAQFRAAPDFGPDALASLFEAANTAVLKARATDPTLSDIATTLVVLLSDGKRAIWGHVGDSRLYVCQGGDVALATADHRNANRELVRAVPAPGLVPDLSSVRQLCRDDAILICVDGFWEALLDPEIAVDNAKSSSAAEWIRYLDWRIRGRRGEEGDSVSAIAVRMLHAGLPESRSKASLPTRQGDGEGGNSVNDGLKDIVLRLVKTHRRAIVPGVIGVAAVLLAALAWSISHVVSSFEAEVLVQSIEERAKVAKMEAEKATRALDQVKADAQDAEVALEKGRAEQAKKNAQSADRQATIASQASTAARETANLAIAQLSKLNGISGKREEASNRVTAAEGLARDAEGAARDARDLARSVGLVVEAKQQASIAQAAAGRVTSLAKQMRAGPNANVDSLVAEARKEAQNAEEAARAAREAYDRLEKSPRANLFFRNWLTEAKEAVDRATSAAKSARADADSEIFEQLASEIESLASTAKTEADTAEKALSAFRRTRRSRQPNELRNAVQEVALAAANAANAFETAGKRRQALIEQSTSNPQATDPLRRAQNAENNARLANARAQEAANAAQALLSTHVPEAVPFQMPPQRPPNEPTEPGSLGRQPSDDRNDPIRKKLNELRQGETPADPATSVAPGQPPIVQGGGATQPVVPIPPNPQESATSGGNGGAVPTRPDDR